MRFAKFAGTDGNPLYVNPAQVRCVRAINEGSSVIEFADSLSVEIKLPADLVAGDIEKASLAK